MKRFFIALIGGTVVLLGVAMIVLPGPGALVILAGLAILATEFIWAQRALRRARSMVARTRQSGGRWWPWRRKPPGPVPPRIVNDERRP